MSNSIKTSGMIAAIIIMLAMLSTACDDGKLNTLVQSERLSIYMEENPSLHLFMNSIYNYRNPVYVCFYNENELSMNSVPAGKFDTEDGVPYGEFTAVSVPEGAVAWYSLKKDAVTPCASNATDIQGNPDYIVYDSFVGKVEGVISYTAPMGYLSESLGGEPWGDICGEIGDSPCEDFAGIGMGGGSLTPQPAPEGKTTLNYAPQMLWNHYDREMTLCWDPDNSGPEPSILLTSLPEPYRENGWPVYEPVTGGTIHLQDGIVDCASAGIANAIATRTMPAQMTFGPSDGLVEFGPDSSGSIVIMGAAIDGIPAEASLRIIPLLHW